MGQSVAVNPTAASKGKVESTSHGHLHDVDIPLLLAVSTLLVFGLLMVYSASWKYSFVNQGDVSSSFTRQLIFAVLGLAAGFVLYMIDYHKLRPFVVPMLLIMIILLIAMIFIFGETRWGSKRTILNGSGQPTEFIKLAVIIYLSFWLFSKRNVLSKFSFGLIPLAGILGTISALIVLEPDLSAAITIIIMGGVLFFIAGGDLKQIVMVLVVAAIIGALIVYLFPTGQARLSTFVAGFQDPAQASYQIKRSVEAIVQGGIFGVGIGNSSTKYTGLPVAATDSIFAVITEETGALGASFTVVLYFIILWRGLRIANHATDLLGKLLASGISIWFFFEAFINMAALVNLFPFAGNTLPLVSAGGSSLVVNLMGLGILFGVNRTSSRLTEKNQERGVNAVADLRRWNRRGSKPRTGNPASPRD